MPRIADWDEVLETLCDWIDNPGQWAEPNFVPPTQESINLAISVAESFRDERRALPLRVVPDGDGDVVFERRTKGMFETMEICGEGIYTTIFKDSQIKGHHHWEAPRMPHDWMAEA